MFRCRRKRCGYAILGAAVVGLAHATVVHAQQAVWVNPSGGLFSDGANWSSGVAPGAPHAAVFDLGDFSYPVQLTADVSNRNLLVRSNAVDLDLGGFSYTLPQTLADTGIASISAQTVLAALRMGNGSLTSHRAYVGVGTGSIGAATVADGAIWTVGYVFYVGDFGNGTLTVKSGGKLHMPNLTGLQSYQHVMNVGRGASGRGTWTVSGDEAVVDIDTSFAIGLQGGQGTLSIENGGRVYSYLATVGGFPQGSLTLGQASVRDAGSVWTTRGGLSLHGGSVTVSNGGVLHSTSVQYADLIDALGTGADAQVRVTGAGSRYQVDAAVIVGHSGRGTLSVESGGEVHGNIDIARLANSAGTVTLHDSVSRVHIPGVLRVSANPQSAGHGGTASVIIDGGEFTVDGRAEVWPKGTIRFNGGKLSAGDLQISGGRVLLAAGADKVVRTTALSIVDGGRIDLANNAMVIDYADDSPLELVRDYIASAFAGGLWNGAGIGTSAPDLDTHGIGYAESSDVMSAFPADFVGEQVDDTSVLIRYTRYGDANLDGHVNLADFNRLAANFGQPGRHWYHGDFNYDGVVNLADFNLLAANFGLSAGPEGPTPDDWSALASAVPEPATLSLTGAAAAAVLKRRRRDSAVH